MPEEPPQVARGEERERENQHFYFSHRPSPLLLGVDTRRDPGEGQF